MARYLTATLLCEGREDARFLGHVLARQLDTFALTEPGFEHGGVFTQDCRTVDDSARVEAAVLDASRHFDLVFVHNDWNERGKIDALRKRVERALPTETRLVGVVPVRETEAWPLSDPSAFPRTSADGAAWMPTRPKDVEAVQDPKRALDKAIGRQYDERVAEWIGERIDLSRLAQVPAYADFLHDLTTALKELRFL